MCSEYCEFPVLRLGIAKKQRRNSPPKLQQFATMFLSMYSCLFITLSTKSKHFLTGDALSVAIKVYCHQNPLKGLFIFECLPPSLPQRTRSTLLRLLFFASWHKTPETAVYTGVVVKVMYFLLVNQPNRPKCNFGQFWVNVGNVITVIKITKIAKIAEKY